jgi:hypothetical protein
MLIQSDISQGFTANQVKMTLALTLKEQHMLAAVAQEMGEIPNVSLRFIHLILNSLPVQYIFARKLPRV